MEMEKKSRETVMCMRGVLPRGFYDRDTRTVAKELLGKILVHETGEGACSGKIVETEAYLGKRDAACHASAGLTKRTSIMFGGPGMAYVYFNYGMHYCFNAVTLPEGKAGAVLIRAVEPLTGIELMKKRRNTDVLENLASGPGKLTSALAIGKTCNGADLTSGALYIKNNREKFVICNSARVGITRAVNLRLRYFIKDNSFVSGQRRRLNGV